MYELRIAGGAWRGRKLFTPKSDAVRPTLGRAREAAFNLLLHHPEMRHVFADEHLRVVDTFAGSGAYGFEALSRGAAHAIFIDHGKEPQAVIRRNAEKLGAENRVTLLGCDIRAIPKSATPCGVIFLDPPYAEAPLARAALTALRQMGWIGPETILILERPAKEAFEIPDGFSLIDRREYGIAALWCMRIDHSSAQEKASHSCF